MTLQEKLGKTVRSLRLLNGLSQEQMSFYAKIDTHYLSNIETGKRNISLNIIEKLADYFGMKVSEFMDLVEQYKEE